MTARPRGNDATRGQKAARLLVAVALLSLGLMPVARVSAADPAPVCTMADHYLPVLLSTAECRDFIVEGQAHQRLVSLGQAVTQDFHAFGPAGCTCLQEVSAGVATSYFDCRFGASFSATLLDYYGQSADNCVGEWAWCAGWGVGLVCRVVSGLGVQGGE